MALRSDPEWQRGLDAAEVLQWIDSGARALGEPAPAAYERFFGRPYAAAGAPIEHYVRCSVDIPGGSVELGLSYEAGEATDHLRTTMRQIAEQAWMSVRAELASDLTAELERRFVGMWPGRAWFVELWNEREALTQVYAPHGMPQRG